MSGTPDLPAGVVTFVFTDIEGSTRLLRTLGDGYAAVLDLHRAILREAWSAHAGHVLGTEGDAFFVVFARASDALDATVDAQRGLERTGWPGGNRLRVRIGVHAGYAQPRGGDYTALAVHQAARVVSAAHGGQVLLSGEVVDRLDAVPPGVAVERLGRFRVRDFDDPVELFGVRAPGMNAVDRQPRVRPEDGHNLVRPTTTLLGREEDLTHVADLIAPGLVTTIVGPGGVGKTRLAVETALAIAGQWADGAWLVDLAPVSEPDLLPETIAETVGAAAVPGADPWTEVCEYLREREALIILDNCERVSDAAALRAARLIEGCPGVGILATGRQPLGLRAEQVHRLEPLATSGPGAPAVQLFLDRATAGAGDDPDAARDLCEELDGLPLAIELAAARTTAMAPREILARLRESPSSVLRSRDPGLPERQRTLEQLIDWSYDLLEPAEQAALGRLSVFADGFSLNLARYACAADGLPATDVPELVWSLVDASLVVCDAAAGATRYRLPATVRAHVAQRAGEAERRAALGRITRAYLGVLGPARVNTPDWLGGISAELNNLREVLAHTTDEAAGQALAWSVAAHHDLLDAFATGIEETTRWADRFRAPGPNRVGLLTCLADLHLRIGALDAAAALLDEAAELASTVGVPDWDDAGLVHTRGEIAQRRGDMAAAAAAATAALEIPHTLRGEVRLLNLLGISLAGQGDALGASEAFRRELVVAHDAGLPTFLATTHGNLAESYLQLGDDAAAAREQAASLELAREHGGSVLIAFSMMIAARLVAARGRAAEAVTLQAAADRVLEGAGFALYDEDVEIRRDLMAAAHDELGEEAFERAQAQGRVLDPDVAGDRAAEVLREVQAAPLTRRELNDAR